MEEPEGILEVIQPNILSFMSLFFFVLAVKIVLLNKVKSSIIILKYLSHYSGGS